MAKQLSRIINSIASLFIIPKNKTAKNKAPEASKIFTFMLKAEGTRKSVNVKASDKSEAEKKVQLQYPDCEAEFLWEMIRNTH